jgi:hypothetical protein
MTDRKFHDVPNIAGYALTGDLLRVGAKKK